MRRNIISFVTILSVMLCSLTPTAMAAKGIEINIKKGDRSRIKTVKVNPGSKLQFDLRNHSTENELICIIKNLDTNKVELKDLLKCEDLSYYQTNIPGLYKIEVSCEDDVEANGKLTIE